MTKVLVVKQHVVQKGDNLDRIARTFGYKGWRNIYYSEFNALLRIRRRDPNLIYPGDLVFFPPYYLDVKENIDEVIGKLKKVKEDMNKTYDDLIQSSRKDLQNIKNYGSKVDGAATVITMFVDLTKIVIGGYRIVMKEMAENAAHRELTKDVLKFAGGPMEGVALNAYADSLKPEESGFWAVSKVTIQSYLDMSSPSFWANAASQVLGGEPIGKAITTRPDDIQRNLEQQINSQRDKMNRELDRKIENYEKTRKVFASPVEEVLPVEIRH